MNRVIVTIIAIMLALSAVACSEEAPPAAQPTDPEPAAPAATSVPAPTFEPAPAASPNRPAPAATAVPPLPAATVAPAPTSEPRRVVQPRATSTPAPTATPLAAQFPVTIIDGNGNEVVFDKPPERIVAFDSAVVEILFAIGEGDRVVGTHSFASYPPEVADIPRVGGAFDMDIEATVALEPDLVFIFFDRFMPDLERTGLRVLYIKTLSDDFTRVADRIRTWGLITGNPASAEVVAADFEARIERIKEIMAPFAVGPSIFQDESDLWTPGPDTLIGQVFQMLKLQNIAYDVSGYIQLSPEVIVERNPQFIIASFSDAISDNPAFKDVNAVKNGAVYVLTSDALSVAGPRYIDGIEDLAALVYPGLFKKSERSR